MELTQEQIDIINSTGNIKINAVAGSGKTTTIIEYAKARPKTCKILYLAFNKSVKIDASKKFTSKGLLNVKVETAHSLAYRYIVWHSTYHVRAQSYKTYEIVDLLGLQGASDKLTKYIIANHINKFITYFCNSDKLKTQDLNYLDTVTENKAKAFVKTYYHYIESNTIHLLNKMEKGEIDITHDFYLKKFQLSNPQLPYDYILFDEGQDASPAMLDVFLKQKAVKVIVGDTHQQIYGWRFAVNSLEKTDFKTFYLSKSFRFSQDIANLATEIIKWKNYISDPIEEKAFHITGAGVSKEIQTKAVLARTNLGLLLKAIEYVTEKKKVKHIYFEGNISSYTYADDGTSLYDVLHLYNGRNRLIKDKLIKTMRDIDELKEYSEKTEDAQLSMLVEIVKDYGDEIPDIINAIKEKHVEKDEKEKAEMIFSTVHRCKGMEYDAVQIVNDFITEEKLKKNHEDSKEKIPDHSRLTEEINLLYVAVTRTKNSIYIPESLLPVNFPYSPQIHTLHVRNGDETKEVKTNSVIKEMPPSGYGSKNKTYTLKEIRLKYNDAYKPWTIRLDDELTQMYCEGVNIKDLAKHFGRTKGAINSRIRKLELVEKYGE